MFLSKIWFFVVAVAATAALAIALVMPLPAERATLASETVRLKRACGITHVLLQQNARTRVDIAAEFARADAPSGSPRLKLDSILRNASNNARITDDIHATAKAAVSFLVESIRDGSKPDIVIVVNRRGRVVTRHGFDDSVYGDSFSGYYLVDDALAGYMRDDIWHFNKRLYRVAAAPVIERREGLYTGAIVVGHEFKTELADRLQKSVGAYVTFYVNGTPVAKPNNVQIHGDVVHRFGSLAESLDASKIGNEVEDCVNQEPFTVTSGETSFHVAVARLPGEARQLGGFYAVFVERPRGVGFIGTLRRVTGDDLAFGSFPWVRVAFFLIVSVALGIFLMLIEGDRPIRRLVNDAVRLAKGDANRLDELQHKGRTGSVARSVNISLEKLEREAKSAKRDLDTLLGPTPDKGGVSRVGAGGPMSIPGAGPGGVNASMIPPPPPADLQLDPSAPLPTVGGLGGGFDFDLPPAPPALEEAAAPPPPVLPAPVPAPADVQVPPPPVALPTGDVLEQEPAVVPPPPISLPQSPEPAPAPAATPPPSIPIPTVTATAPPAIPDSPPPLPPAEPEPEPAPPQRPSMSIPITPSGARASRQLQADRLSIDDDILGDDDAETLIAPASVTSPPSAPASPPTFDDPTRVSDPSQALLAQSAMPDGEDEFRSVFDEFTALKQQCGESTESLTYTKFCDKLTKNRDALIAKHACKSVRFQVYIKDGKAALKATPIKA